MISHLGWELLDIFILRVGIVSCIWILAIWRWDCKASMKLTLGNSCPAVFGLVICNWNILDLRLPNISVLYSILVVEFNQVKHIYAFWHKQPAPNAQNDVVLFVECKLKNYLRSGTVASNVSKGMVNMMFDKTSSLQMVNREKNTFLRQRWTKLFRNK